MCDGPNVSISDKAHSLHNTEADLDTVFMNPWYPSLPVTKQF